jgi:hypothetical protein
MKRDVQRGEFSPLYELSTSSVYRPLNDSTGNPCDA